MNAFRDARGVVHALAYTNLGDDGWQRLTGRCGKRVKHNDAHKNRATTNNVDCMACIAIGAS